MLDTEDDYFLEEDKLGETEIVEETATAVDALASDFIRKSTSDIVVEDPLPISIEKPKDEVEVLLQVQSCNLFHDRLGMTVTSGIVNIKKDSSNLIGISIGGGAPYCPCLYIVQVFDNTPASREGTLQSGDELLAVNGQSVKGKTKVEVAKMIQACQNEVNIKYNKLHADPIQGKTLDIVLKKVKHRLVENMSGSTADALGLSRAILCNDTLVKKLQELHATENMYRGLVEHTKRVMKAFYSLLHVYKAFGDAFAEIGVREPQARASEAFSTFGDYHRLMEKNGIQTLKSIRPILSDLGTYLHKAIPDTKLTIRKYADAKFEYLSYCLKVKEMDDEEYSYAALQEPLYRVETGNYEYRLILRCRQEARAKFAKLRSDVLEKLELLDNKHVQDIGHQLESFIGALVKFYTTAEAVLKAETLFPIEMDLSTSAFQYASTNTVLPYEDEEDDEMLEVGRAVGEETADTPASDGLVRGLDRVTDLLLPADGTLHLLSELDSGSADAPSTDLFDESRLSPSAVDKLSSDLVQLQSTVNDTQQLLSID